jgi:hypothetical protein
MLCIRGHLSRETADNRALSKVAGRLLGDRSTSSARGVELNTSILERATDSFLIVLLLLSSIIPQFTPKSNLPRT